MRTQEHWLDPVFLMNFYTNENLFKRCLKGLTQNQNESENSIYGAVIPKIILYGEVEVNLAVSDTVCYFNTCIASRASLLNKVNNTPTKNISSTLRKEDTIKATANKMLACSRQRRKQ